CSQAINLCASYRWCRDAKGGSSFFWGCWDQEKEMVATEAKSKICQAAEERGETAKARQKEEGEQGKTRWQKQTSQKTAEGVTDSGIEREGRQFWRRES